MPDITMTIAMSPYDRVQPLLNGEVKPDGIKLEYHKLPGPDIFYRQLKFSQFDIAEMSFSSFLRARAQGWGYRALPVFHNRNFSYTNILIRIASEIRPGHPEDLKGRRVGVADYQQTAAVWQRGVLQHEFGVAPSDMVWYQERTEHFSHGGASNFRPPPGVEFHYCEDDLGTMFQRGDLDAAFTYITGTGIDRPKVDLTKDPGYTRLFPDARAEATRYYQKTGIYPPHHTTVVRESFLTENPWIALNLMDAFTEAKRVATENLRRLPPTLLMFGGQLLSEVQSTFGPDPFVYGVKPNAEAIEMLQQMQVEQGLTERKQPWDELFPEEVLYSEERL